MAMRVPASASTGAVDEETFIRAFEEVPTVQIFSARELGKQMKTIQETILDPIPNKDWNKRADALKKLRSLIIAGATNYGEFHGNLRQLEIPLQVTIKDFRSQVVREACITITYLAQTLGIKFDHSAECLLNQLINLIQNSAKVVATAGHIAVRFILQYTQSSRLIPIITNNMIQSKSQDIRRSCCEFLEQILTQWPTHHLERHITALSEALRKGVADADPDARVMSRRAFRAFKEHSPDQAEALLQSLEPSYRRALQGELCLSSSSSSNSLAQTPSLRTPTTPQSATGERRRQPPERYLPETFVLIKRKRRRIPIEERRPDPELFIRAGAVDEETFIRAFEEVPTVQIFSARELWKQMKTIQETIADPNKDWNKRADALKKLRSLIIAGATNYGEFHGNLRQLEIPLQVTIKDLRSQVVREACITITYLAQTLGIKFDHSAECLLNELINLIQNSAKVVATAGHIAVRFILQYTQSSRLIPIITNNMIQSKSQDIRRSCCEFLEQILTQWPTYHLERHITALSEALRKGVADADPDARVMSRRAFRAFKEHSPDQAEALLQSLEPSYRRALQGELCLSSSSSSNSLAQTPGLRTPTTPQSATDGKYHCIFCPFTTTSGIGLFGHKRIHERKASDFQKKHKKKKSDDGGDSNVEFGNNTFSGNGAGDGMEPMDVAYSLDPISNKSRDHNPMNDAVQNNSEAVGNGSSALYEVPMDMNKSKRETFTEPPSAIIATSSVRHKTSHQVQQHTV